jgi:hypothetical protein
MHDALRTDPAWERQDGEPATAVAAHTAKVPESGNLEVDTIEELRQIGAQRGIASELLEGIESEDDLLELIGQRQDPTAIGPLASTDANELTAPPADNADTRGPTTAGGPGDAGDGANPDADPARPELSESMSREDLDAAAANAGVEGAANLPNKAAVIAAVKERQGA